MRRAAVVQYHTSADSAEHNRNLIEHVVIELAARDPGGLDYQVFQFEDGVGFLHVAVFDGTTDSETARATILPRNRLEMAAIANCPALSRPRSRSNRS